MKVKNKNSGIIGYSNMLNTCGLGEIIVSFKNGGTTSDFIKDYYIYLEQKEKWEDISKAFKNKDIITDNFNKYFIEPKKKEDKNRGFYF